MDLRPVRHRAAGIADDRLRLRLVLGLALGGDVGAATPERAAAGHTSQQNRPSPSGSALCRTCAMTAISSMGESISRYDEFSWDRAPDRRASANRVAPCALYCQGPLRVQAAPRTIAGRARVSDGAATANRNVVRDASNREIPPARETRPAWRRFPMRLVGIAQNGSLPRGQRAGRGCRNPSRNADVPVELASSRSLSPLQDSAQHRNCAFQRSDKATGAARKLPRSAASSIVDQLRDGEASQRIVLGPPIGGELKIFEIG